MLVRINLCGIFNVLGLGADKENITLREENVDLKRKVMKLENKISMMITKIKCRTWSEII